MNQLDLSRLPRHIAVIMDGNGRWAKKMNKPRIEGHRAGAQSVREVVETCARLGIKFLTLYAFSKENWKRPKKEVLTLWKLLESSLKKEDKLLIKNKLRLITIGQKQRIPEKVRYELERVENLTADYDRMIVILALNYSGRAEIVDAVKKMVKDNGFDINSLDEKKFSENLYTANFPDPDLLIRTSGEFRISNFLLWQIAYSEIWTTPEFWPEFRAIHLLQALLDYQKRERRFGGIHSRGYL
ncbi:isoprenyl transferase [Acidobacteriota bacterium]